jgi:nucleoside-diphosphate-sugar epimerase
MEKTVFITGITGYIGGSVAKLLLDKAYKVTGLVRNESALQAVNNLGAEAVLGSIQDEELLKDLCSKADIIIHTADSADDAFAVASFLKILENSGKTFIFTSGSAIFGNRENGELSEFCFTEDIPLEPRLEMVSRVYINNSILKAAKNNIKSIVIVPTMVYGEGLGLKKESIQIPALINFSKSKNAGIYIEKGENIWSNVHIRDLAELYVLAVEKAKAGSLFYAENGNSNMKNIANTISEKYHLNPTKSIRIAEAVDQFGQAGAYFGFASNSYCNADKAKAELGWEPQHNDIHEFI